MTAAWLHGIDVDPCDPIEATVPPHAGVSGRSGIAVRRAGLAAEDVVRVRGMPATTMERTIAELCGRLSVTEAVVVADAALHKRRIRLDQLASWAEAHPGMRGIRNLRRVITFAEPGAESPMESRLRMILVLAGLPRPRVQVSIHDAAGRFAGRPDLYYEHPRLGIEYDGEGHRHTLASDNQRQNRLLNAEVRLLRFSAADVIGRHQPVVSQVRAMLAGL
jgi:very-short-patch-repair endonuclease